MLAARLAFVVAIVAACASARAEGEPMSVRPAHVSIGAGGGLAITGAESAFSFGSISIYPGGALSRFGGRLEARGLGRVLPNAVLAGLTFEAAASRPRLVLALYASAGATTDGNVCLAAGLETTFGVVGPLALGLDTGGLLVIDGTADSELVLGSALTVRIVR